MPVELEQWLWEEAARTSSKPNTESWKPWLEKQAEVREKVKDIYQRTQALFKSNSEQLSKISNFISISAAEGSLRVEEKKGRLVDEKKGIWEPVYVFTRFSDDSEARLFILSPNAVSNAFGMLIFDPEEMQGLNAVLNQLEDAIYPMVAA